MWLLNYSRYSGTGNGTHTETYGYDADLDYLIGADYADGLANATPTWSYDAAGNRAPTVTDNLNRATALGGGTTCTNDILGNRTTIAIGSNGFHYAYEWDALNRLTHYPRTDTGNTWSTSYLYRADGMRTWTSWDGESAVAYRYDGQMPIEDAQLAGPGKVTRYGLSARGIDYIEQVSTAGTNVGFPIYDAHGNNVATLNRSVSSYTVNDRRAYGAWGVVRPTAVPGHPKLRYCGYLGHKQDDESGLIYMRARYYEPTTGRFIVAVRTIVSDVLPSSMSLPVGPDG